MTKAILTFTLMVSMIVSCSKPADNSVTTDKVGSEKVMTLHLKEIKDSLTLHLADLVEGFEFIPLETRDECMVSWGHCYVTKEFILFKQWQDRILQFDRSGKYLRTLLQYGKGPRDYTDAGWTVDEDKQILYVSDIQKQNYFLRFDLRSGEYLGDLPKANVCSCNQLFVTTENTLIIAPQGILDNDSHPSLLFWQDLEGGLLDTIAIPDSALRYRTYASFYPYEGDYRYFISGRDTLYRLHNKTLTPEMVIDFGQDQPASILEIGYQALMLNFETTRWLSLANHIITENPGGTNPQGPMEYYMLDKKEMKIYFQGNILVNPTNQTLSYRSIEGLGPQDNGYFSYIYQAVDLIEQAEKAFADPDFKEPYRSKLQMVVNRISENDNPVLLVGRVKN